MEFRSEIPNGNLLLYLNITQNEAIVHFRINQKPLSTYVMIRDVETAAIYSRSYKCQQLKKLWKVKKKYSQ